MSKEDYSSLDSILETMYEAISFGIGEEPDWERMKKLFHPDAVIVPPGSAEKKSVTTLEIESFIDGASRHIESQAKFKEKGFLEVEIYRIEEKLGNMASVFSTYQSFYGTEGEKPLQRGVNNLLLINDGKRWWILSLAWEVETGAKKIPDEYLP